MAMVRAMWRKFLVSEKALIHQNSKLMSQRIRRQNLYLLSSCLARNVSTSFHSSKETNKRPSRRGTTGFQGEAVTQTCDSIPSVDEQKLLKVAIIGEPNSGKSTLTNRLVGEKICAVTEVPHTTRQQATGVLCKGNSQVVILDTPGIVTFSEGRKLKMSRQHMIAPENALLEADLIAVLHDAASKKRRNRIHEEILKALDIHKDIPSVLVLNKVDILKHKAELLGVAALLTEDRECDTWGYKEIGGWSKFDNVFMISSRNGDGIVDLIEYFIAKATLSKWIYPAGINTDQSLDVRIKEIFREIFLKLYEHEIPWQINQVTVLCELKSNGHRRIHQKLYCRRKSQRRCVLEKIKLLNTMAVSDLEILFGCPVELTIDVTVRDKPLELLPRDDPFIGVSFE